MTSETFSAVMPPMAMMGKGIVSTTCFSTLGTAHRACVFFRAGHIHRAETDVVRSFCKADPCLFEGCRRASDEFIFSEQFSRKRNREVTLAQMDSIRIGCNGNIDSVVDDERDPGTPAHGKPCFSPPRSCGVWIRPSP